MITGKIETTIPISEDQIEAFRRDGRMNILVGKSSDGTPLFVRLCLTSEGLQSKPAVGDLDGGAPNHFDHTKRGFQP